MIRRLTAPSRFLTAAACLTLCACSTPDRNRPIDETRYAAPIRVACVGDSITYGAGIEDREHNSYPAQLSRMLGDQWEVRNFGVSGATLLKKGNRPYWDQQAYRDALAFKPDVVVIKLGTNDSKPRNWKFQHEFVADYLMLIQSFSELESQPRIWICLPVPAFPDNWGITDEVIAGEVIPHTRTVAQQADLPVIDLHTALAGDADLFPDKIHPNAEGAGEMAEAIFAAVTGRTAVAH